MKLCLLFVLGVGALLLGAGGLVWRSAQPQILEEFPEEQLYLYLHTDFEEDWMSTLAHGPIHHVQVWNPYGLSKKFKVVFADGKVASGKLMKPFSFWDPGFRPQVFREADRRHKRYSRSAWGDYQALGELGSFYVDRALGWMRKPPTSGRRISNKMLYAMDDSWWGFFQRALPEYEIEVGLIAWFDGITVNPPEDQMLEVMLHRAPSNVLDLRLIVQIADVMVFDFLVDDHDRIEGHNWLKDQRGKYIFWDSGLAWRHGTTGKRERDRDIFCGRREWVALTSARSEDHTCQRTCMFHNSTIAQLRTFGLGTEEYPGTRLSRAVKQEMKKDPLYPIFDHNAYLPGRQRFPKVSYRYTDFLEGLDIRVLELLIYVDECIATYGEEAVLVNDPVEDV